MKSGKKDLDSTPIKEIRKISYNEKIGNISNRENDYSTYDKYSFTGDYKNYLGFKEDTKNEKDDSPKIELSLDKGIYGVKRNQDYNYKDENNFQKMDQFDRKLMKIRCKIDDMNIGNIFF